MGNGCSSERSESMVHLNRENIPNYKIVLIGDPGVGKTNVLLRYSRNQFDYSYRPTRKVTIENVVKKLNVPLNLVVSVTLWDLPGTEDIDLRSTYYKNADAAIVVVDMSDDESIDKAPEWRQDFLKRASRTQEVQEVLPNGIKTNKIVPIADFDPESIPILLLGNKYDVVEDRIREEKLEEMVNGNDEDDPLKPISDELEAEEKQAEGQEDIKSIGNQQVTKKDKLDPAEKEIEKGMKDMAKSEDKEENSLGNSEEDANLSDLIDRDEDEEDRELMFTPQRGQHLPHETPACVRRLEEIEQNNSFVGRNSEAFASHLHEVGQSANFLSSIVVSSRDKDGSVDAALQSLVRHLLEKANICPKQPKKPVPKKVQKKANKKVIENGFQPIKTCGVKEIDVLFRRTNVVLRRVFEYTTFYEVTLHKIKQGCADVGIITETRASLEDCIEAIQRTVQEEMNRQVKLEEEGEFPKIHIEIDEEEDKILIKQMKMFLKLVDDFHKEYCHVCQVILRESPTLEALLDKLDSRISTKADEMWDSLNVAQKTGLKEQAREKARVERLCDACEKSRARIAHARLKVQENVKVVGIAREKIKAALLW